MRLIEKLNGFSLGKIPPAPKTTVQLSSGVAQKEPKVSFFKPIKALKITARFVIIAMVEDKMVQFRRPLILRNYFEESRNVHARKGLLASRLESFFRERSHSENHHTIVIP